MSHSVWRDKALQETLFILFDTNRNAGGVVRETLRTRGVSNATLGTHRREFLHFFGKRHQLCKNLKRLFAVVEIQTGNDDALSHANKLHHNRNQFDVEK